MTLPQTISGEPANELVATPTELGIVIKDESYNALVEELNAIKTERKFNANIELVYMYHDWGTIINEYQKAHDVGVTKFIQELRKDSGIAERSLFFAKKCAERWPTKEILETSLPEGKATSWAKTKKLLGGGEEMSKAPDLSVVAKGLVKRYGERDAQFIAQLVINHLEQVTEGA